MRPPPGLGVLVALLLVGAAGTAVYLARGGAPVGRLSAVVAAALLVAVAAGCLRARAWALGAAFILGLCWTWATVALTLQATFTPAQTFMWLAWAFGVMLASVRAKREG